MKRGGLLSLRWPKVLWQHRVMIEVRTLNDHHPDLAHPLMLCAALLTLRYAQEQGQARPPSVQDIALADRDEARHR